MPWAPPTRVDGRTLAVVLVDDEPGILRAFGRVARVLPLILRCGANADEGWRLLEESPADVVISDLRMPGLDGLSFLRRVRARANPPFCILHTATPPLKVEPGVAVLEKPCDVVTLARLLAPLWATN